MAFDSINNPDVWADSDGTTPPVQYDANSDGSWYWDENTANLLEVNHIGTNYLPATLRIRLTITTPPDGTNGSDYVRLKYKKANGATGFYNAGAVAGSFDISLTDHWRTPGSFYFQLQDNGDGGMIGGTVASLIECETTFNCECETALNAETLSALRAKLARLTGYASQASNLPTHISSKFNTVLAEAQDFLWRTHPTLQTERFFTWQARVGYRYYDLDENIDCCVNVLDQYKISGAWFEDTDGAWHPLARGIDPRRYVTVDDNALPNTFEVRECLEVFPGPSEAGKIRLLGKFGLSAFAADGDYSTIDGFPILHWAAGMILMDSNERKANMHFGMARQYIRSQIAGGHNGRRYIPGRSPAPPPPRPIMTSYNE